MERAEVERLLARCRALTAVIISDEPQFWLDEAQRSNCYFTGLLYALHVTDAATAILWYSQRNGPREPVKLVALSRLGLRTKQTRRQPPLSVRIGHGIVGRAAADERTLRVSRETLLDLSENPWLVRDEGWAECIVFPLLFDSECVGALSLYDRGAGVLTEDLGQRLSAQMPVATLQTARASRDHRRNKEADRMVEGAMRLQAGLAMVGLVHDLARHARNVNDWAVSLRPVLKEISLKAGIPETVDDMIASADVVGKITSSMDKLALGRDDNRIKVRIDQRLEALKAVLVQLDRRIQVEVDGSAIIVGPDSLVERIVFNLVVNSLHWTRDDDREIKVAFLRVDDGDTATLSVTDNGQGMSPEQLNVVREPFESFRENGSGLGLFLVDQLCQSVGAQLAIFSEPFRSTTVTITFEKLEG